MSMSGLNRDIRHLDRALDKMAEAAYFLGQTNDWIALAALYTLEGMMDDLGDRLAELRGIRDVMNKMEEERNDRRANG